MLQMGIRNELIEVSKPLMVPGKQDDMVRARFFVYFMLNCPCSNRYFVKCKTCDERIEHSDIAFRARRQIDAKRRGILCYACALHIFNRMIAKQPERNKALGKRHAMKFALYPQQFHRRHVIYNEMTILGKRIERFERLCNRHAR
ncbi:hypothetical protein SDC9_161071 [bioreactor metagenome]|uniref:Uncharacterized protein n=1 Tax=bioreactor metagenome TaxID=1076179 RepID=A0A645FJB9_9ZZZZ